MKCTLSILIFHGLNAGTVCCVKSSSLMFGISYGELFLILGATAALIGIPSLAS